jgi:hypothetical protein
MNRSKSTATEHHGQIATSIAQHGRLLSVLGALSLGSSGGSQSCSHGSVNLLNEFQSIGFLLEFGCESIAELDMATEKVNQIMN